MVKTRSSKSRLVNHSSVEILLRDKSFLVLYFKKEPLALLALRQGSASFLKKRSKKLLSVILGTG
jgi:hypothetical protein